MLSKTERTVAERYVRALLRTLGHDVNSPDLRRTPARFVKYLEEYSGHCPKPKLTVFPSATKGLIVQTPIPFSSVCAHHLIPFIGFATVGYIPGKKMLGLSKLKRVVDLFAHNLQNQEQLTEQIAGFIMHQFKAKGVGVILKAEHNCMCVRGVRVSNVWTTTTRLYGAIAEDSCTRAEFLAHHNYHVQAQ